MITQKELRLQARSRGYHLISREIESLLELPEKGLLNLFLQHTSAGLTINENADPSVLDDLQAWMDRSVPQDARLYAHRAEGPDDMPAHIRAAITASSVTIPVMNGRMALGTWQGIFLWEHRHSPKQRHIIVSVH